VVERFLFFWRFQRGQDVGVLADDARRVFDRCRQRFDRRKHFVVWRRCQRRVVCRRLWRNNLSIDVNLTKLHDTERFTHIDAYKHTDNDKHTGSNADGNGNAETRAARIFVACLSSISTANTDTHHHADENSDTHKNSDTSINTDDTADTNAHCNLDIYTTDTDHHRDTADTNAHCNFPIYIADTDHHRDTAVTIAHCNLDIYTADTDQHHDTADTNRNRDSYATNEGTNRLKPQKLWADCDRL
jgi:hypothetical protein